MTDEFRDYFGEEMFEKVFSVFYGDEEDPNIKVIDKVTRHTGADGLYQVDGEIEFYGMTLEISDGNGGGSEIHHFDEEMVDDVKDNILRVQQQYTCWPEMNNSITCAVKAFVTSGGIVGQPIITGTSGESFEGDFKKLWDETGIFPVDSRWVGGCDPYTPNVKKKSIVFKKRSDRKYYLKPKLFEGIWHQIRKKAIIPDYKLYGQITREDLQKAHEDIMSNTERVTK